MRVIVRCLMLAATCALISPGDVGSAAPARPARDTGGGGAKADVAHARGMFDVKLTPQAAARDAGDARLGRMSIEKQYRGDLQGSATGEMLTALTAVEGSAGYVAIERVSGTLEGRSGTFVLQHHGLMTRGAQQLTITVVPDSGTGDLAGLSGTMAIEIADGKHSYDFEYTLPPRK